MGNALKEIKQYHLKIFRFNFFKKTCFTSSMGPLSMFLDLTLPLLSPVTPLPPPLCSLSLCSLFPCLWFNCALTKAMGVEWGMGEMGG